MFRYCLLKKTGCNIKIEEEFDLLENNYEVTNKVFNTPCKSKIITLLNHPETIEYIRFAERLDYETDNYELKITVPRRLLRKIEEEL